MDPLWTSSPACNLKNPGRNQVGDESGLKGKHWDWWQHQIQIKNGREQELTPKHLDF